MTNPEASFGVLLRHYLRANPRYSAAMELKQTSKGSIPFSCLEAQQIDYLKAIKSKEGTLVRVMGGGGEPDYIYLRDEPAFVVVKFPREFHFIDVDTFLLEKKNSRRRSLTNARARDISIHSVEL